MSTTVGGRACRGESSFLNESASFDQRWPGQDAARALASPRPRGPRQLRPRRRRRRRRLCGQRNLAPTFRAGGRLDDVRSNGRPALSAADEQLSWSVFAVVTVSWPTPTGVPIQTRIAVPVRRKRRGQINTETRKPGNHGHAHRVVAGKAGNQRAAAVHARFVMGRYREQRRPVVVLSADGCRRCGVAARARPPDSASSRHLRVRRTSSHTGRTRSPVAGRVTQHLVAEPLRRTPRREDRQTSAQARRRTIKQLPEARTNVLPNRQAAAWRISAGSSRPDVAPAGGGERIGEANWSAADVQHGAAVRPVR